MLTNKENTLLYSLAFYKDSKHFINSKFLFIKIRTTIYLVMFQFMQNFVNFIFSNDFTLTKIYDYLLTMTIKEFKSKIVTSIKLVSFMFPDLMNSASGSYTH